MTGWRLVLRSLWFHRRSHLAVLVGVSIASAVLTGSLLVGDSVRAGLLRLAMERIGGVKWSVGGGGDRLFGEDLGERVLRALREGDWSGSASRGGVSGPEGPGLGGGGAAATSGAIAPPGAGAPPGATPGAGVVPAMMMRATVSAPLSGERAGAVWLMGVDRRFWTLWPDGVEKRGHARSSANDLPAASESRLAVKIPRTLAARLGAGIGSELAVRADRPRAVAMEGPISGRADDRTMLRAVVSEVVGDERGGRFGLHAQPVPPPVIYADLHELQARIGEAGRANLLLIGGAGGGSGGAATLPDEAAMARALEGAWSLDDAGLVVAQPIRGVVELVSRGVFLGPAVERVVSDADGRVLTYLVNELRCGERSVPYSMVGALGGPMFEAVIPGDTAEDAVVINRWLAEELSAGEGDRVRMRYWVLPDDGGTERVERESVLTVRAVVENEPEALGGSAARSLMPSFPGVSDRASCREWDPGFAIDLGRVRPQDEAYWDRYGGTPKAYVTLAAGRRMWGNRFGALTAARWSSRDADAVARQVRRGLSAGEVGLTLVEHRDRAIAAARQGVDFGGLFTGLSVFLVAAAVVLAALMAGLAVDGRSAELGVLAAIGFPRRRIVRWLMAEMLVVVSAGAIIGAAAGVGYTWLVMRGLDGIWAGAIGAGTDAGAESGAEPPVGPGMTGWGVTVRGETLAIGATAAGCVAGLAVGWVVRRRTRWDTVALLRGTPGAEDGSGMGPGSPAGFRWVVRSSGRAWLIGGGALFVAGLAATVGWGVMSDAVGAVVFASAGGVMLLGAVSGWWGLLRCWASGARQRTPRTGAAGEDGAGGAGGGGGTGVGLGRWRWAMRGSGRRPGRGAAVVGVLACGCFMVVAVGASAIGGGEDPRRRSSGTGGFAWMVRTSRAMGDDPSTESGRAALGLGEWLGRQGVVSLRVHEGDEASCLNLQRALGPTLLGVRPGEMARRGAFTFAGVDATLARSSDRGAGRDSGWLLLEAELDDGSIPAIGDAESVRWSMGKRPGDTLSYTDEHGRAFRVRIVATLERSILQGSLLVSERRLVERYPTRAPRCMLLVDAPSSSRDEPSDLIAARRRELSRALEDVGGEVIATADRLAELDRVQNTYRSVFRTLGGLGLLLGMGGVGAVVIRNVRERRGELAAMRAMGFDRRLLLRLMVIEHGLLVGMGLLSGLTAGLAAVLPMLRGSDGAGRAWAVVGWVLLIGVTGAAVSAWSAWRSMDAEVIAALREP